MDSTFYIKPEKDVLLKGEFSFCEKTRSILKDVILERIKIDTLNKAMELDINSKIIIDDAVKKDIVNSILKKEMNFDTVKLNINLIEQKSNKEDMLGYLNKNWQNIICALKVKHPAAGGALAHNRFTYDDINKTLIIELKSDISINLVLSKNCDILINELVKKDTNQNIKVTFTKKEIFLEIEAFRIQTQESVKSEIKRIENESLENAHIILGREIKNAAIIKISDLDGEENRIAVEGAVLNVETREFKSFDNNQCGVSVLTKFIITDYTNSIYCVYKGSRALRINNKDCVRIDGKTRFDKNGELVIIPNSINKIDLQSRTDSFPDEKRIELHLHTNMSKMDALIDVDDLIKTLKQWNHTACAITDHGIVHNFPEFYEKCKKNNIKHILGVEGYLVDAVSNIFSGFGDKKFSADCPKTFVSVISDNLYSENILGIRALRTTENNAKLFEYFLEEKKSQLKKIFPKNLEPDDSENLPVSAKFAASKEKLIEKFKKFCADTVLTGFDINIQIKSLKDFCGFDLNLPEFDLRQICLLNIKYADDDDSEKQNNPESHYLKQSLDYYGIDDGELNAGNLEYLSNKTASFNLNVLYNNINPETLKNLFDKIIVEYGGKNDFSELNDFNSLHQTSESIMKTKGANHIIILVKNQTGLKNLYKLVSLAHLNYSHYTPKIPRQKFIELRSGLIFGGACEQGEIFSSILKKKSVDRTVELLRFYDYAELMPVENNKFLKTFNICGVESEDDIKKLNLSLFAICEKVNKLIAATSDAHFLHPEEGIYRMAIQHYIGMKEKRDITNLCFKTTAEMLEEFKYLGETNSKKLVIDNPKKIADMIENVKPVPDGFYPPRIENADTILTDIVYEKAYRIYGDPLPDIVKSRLEKELTAIIKNQFANLYLLAHKIVKKSNDDGIIVGSRGSVGSSFVAFLAGITDVNSLPPHYVCPKCKKSFFDVPKEFIVGVDLPDKLCDDCSVKMIKDGYDIFFEVFLGFKGDKVPDIDLNFPGYYQPVIHKYVEELFGKENVFRAGTISTISEGIAKMIAEKFVDERKLTWNSAEKARVSAGCLGVKKTTGQHPGGMIIVPKDKEIYEFCPIQYPSDRTADDVITTHFDYHKMENQLVKLDMLGQDDPAQLLLLKEYTGFDFNNIPYDDKKTLELFSSTKSIGLKEQDIDSKTATFAVPEFGTEFVRGMLEDTKPSNIGELIRISGLSHGTDVWQNNAQDLIRSGKIKLNQVISARDDIMLYLINLGMEPHKAFRIMENVRKGKGLNEDEIKSMTECGVQKWYINSCQKIKYLFPKAHAVAYVVMAYKISYYKAHFPVEFYASFLTIKSDLLNIEYLLMDAKQVAALLKQRQKDKYSLTQKERVEMTILEVVKELKLRKIGIKNIDIKKSLAQKSLVDNGEILPPLVSIPGLGLKAAENIVNERKKEEFRTISDFCQRCKVNKKVLEELNKFKCLEDLPESETYSLF